MTIYDDAYALLPNHGMTARATKGFGLRSWGTATPVTSEPTEPAVRALIERAVLRLASKGLPLPEDIAASILAARRDDEEAAERARLMQHALSTIGSREKAVVPATIKPALEFLRTRLGAVKTEAASLAPALAGIRNASDVLNSTNPDAVPAWQRANELVGTYQEIRSTQESLYRDGWDMSQTAGLTSEMLDKAGHFADAVDHLRSYVEQRQHSAHLSAQKYSDRPEALAEYDAWLAAATVSPAFEEAEPALRLVHACTTMVPWVPNVDDLIAAFADNYLIVNSPEQRNLDQLVEARERYTQRVSKARAASSA